MYERKETKGYIWIIPLIAACLATIAILFPTAKFSSGGVTWD
jgi:paraquat-inducible protein B